MTGELFIKTTGTNGWVDAYTTWGVSFTDAALSSLMTPAPMKAPAENKSRLEHGKRVITDSQYTRKDEREVTMEMHITAPDKAEFWRRYWAFCQQVLDKQFIDIRSGYVPKVNNDYVVFHMTYESCSQFSEFMQEMAKFTLKLNEPNPDDRKETTTI